MTHKICPVCDSGRTSLFLDRGRVPVHQNILCSSRGNAIGYPRGVLSMIVCLDCGFVYNRDFDGELLDYGHLYDNNQNYSQIFKDHIDVLVDELLYKEHIDSCKILEVGCGNGHFIESIIANGKNNTGVGYDPCYSGEPSLLDGRLCFVSKMFDQDIDVKADVAISRHVIEHVPDPVVFLKHIRRALPVGGKLYLETPCVEWIFKNNVLWDFFYEHCSIFSENSIRTALNLAGFGDIEVRHVFGEQYLWVKATAKNTTVKNDHVVQLAISYGHKEETRIADLRDRIEQTSSSIAVWGAGAKGATFLNIIDPDRKYVDCVIDINPAKQNKYIPGSGHLIISPEDMEKHGIGQVVIMNPNYTGEIEKTIKNLSLKEKIKVW